MNLAEIKAEFGSLEALEKQSGKIAVNLKAPWRKVELLRDSHGHYVVQHDLFNHDGLTEDGIAEAFAEFGSKERLSFF